MEIKPRQKGIPMKIVAYYRVSTRKQGERDDEDDKKKKKIPGLGLEAQQGMVKDFSDRNDGKIIAEYTEIESGRNSKRPELQKAINHARSARATLVVAKLDRLSRNMSFTAALMDSDVEFVVCDFPQANRLTIHILAAMAEYEAVMISRRTKDALSILKSEGKKLGSARPGHWEGREHLRGWKEGVKKSVEARQARARSDYAYILPEMQQMREDGKTYDEICAHLNEQGYTSSRGGPFVAATVCRILQRADDDAGMTPKKKPKKRTVKAVAN